MWQWHTHSFPWKFATAQVHVSHLWQSILKTFFPRDVLPAVLMSICSHSLASRSWGLCAVPSPVSHSRVSTPSGQCESLAPYQGHRDAQWLHQSSAKAQVDSIDTLLLVVSSLCCQHVPLILLFWWENFYLLFSWVIPCTFNNFLRHTGQILTLTSGWWVVLVQMGYRGNPASQGWRMTELCLE